MPFTPFGWVDEPSAKLTPSTKKNNNVPVSQGWAAARQEQLNARTSGRQAAPNVDPLVAPIAGQRHGPAYRGGPNDVFSPQGFGVTGLKDVYGVDLPTPGLPRPAQPTGTPAMGGDTTKTNANGVTQTGKQMTVSAAFVPEYANSSFNDLFQQINGRQYQEFSSHQLPTTQGNPFEGAAPKTDGFNPAAPGITGATYDNYGAAGGVAAASSTDKSEFTPMTGKEERIEGGSDRKKGGSLADALADTAGINSYMSKFSSGDQERAANRAFLDTEGSMAGLRAKEAVNGVVYAGGNHYVAGESADSKAVPIKRSDARDISNNKAKAQDFLAKKTADAVAATKQEPTTLESAASSQAFKQDKPMTPGINTDIGGSTEFFSNNDNTLPGFGAPKGYKSQSTYKDPSFPNPFSR
jgi:hypothetical protein